MNKHPAPTPTPLPEICQWIKVPFSDIRTCFEQNAWRLGEGAEESFYFADDSLPESLESNWLGANGNWRCQTIPRLHLMLEGEHTLTFVRHEKPNTVKLQPGDIWFFPADAHDNEFFSHSCRYLGVVFQPTFTRFIVANYSIQTKTGLPQSALRRTLEFHWPEERPPVLTAALNALTLATKRDVPGGIDASVIRSGHYLARAVWLMVHDWVLHTHHGQPPLSKAHASWLSIDRYLQENYHRPLNRKSAAQAVGLHPNRISALCSEFAGKSFKNILEERRLKQATRFLETSDHKIETISALCGYTSAAYFSRIFRSVMGMTPGTWRLTHTTNEHKSGS